LADETVGLLGRIAGGEQYQTPKQPAE
jgi:hypothetical protein